MSQTQFPRQDAFIRECRHLKADLEVQADILKSSPQNLGTDQVRDIAHEMNRISHHVDNTVKLGFDMIANEPNCTVISRNLPFWLKQSHTPHSGFQGVLYSMQRTVDQIGFALRKHPRKQLPTNLIKDLRDMAGVLETNLCLNES
ncbi:unnamed protein product [Penicillium salamii]|uniref:Uncharacterized protein n=1 Tax=Penicillium salamii TaxID=1612424 RepID=A0A9W4J920_9EURO|nr:unnamed protein product [Penicillium salamii]CAG8168181.1 unnamed protein product [Penicillium salamii]CAG8248049.1 unnamed protein product [Penicillium salamii]CAG8306863.1 unnamed protein product [Penicillium salamii]CAG8373190.1 unnamed protein product [Penicillium salamii]